jgi:hypothetical protein
MPAEDIKVQPLNSAPRVLVVENGAIRNWKGGDPANSSLKKISHWLHGEVANEARL